MATATKTKIVWNGSEQLKDMLVPVEDVKPHPTNPRRGNMREIGDSLARFGQVKPIVLDNDGVILAGGNVYRAAVELMGWSHVAASVAAHLTDDNEAFLYLLADNRASDESAYDASDARMIADHLASEASRLEAELDGAGDMEQSARDAMAERARGFRVAAEALEASASKRVEDAGIIDPAGLAVEYRCPHEACSYEWSGGA